MTRDEFELIVAREILPRWPHAAPISEKSIRAWHEDLADLNAAQVESAVMALARDGREFAPNGAQIRSKVIELGVDAPDFSRVLEELRALMGRGYAYPEGQGGPTAEERVRMRQGLSAHARLFAEYLGVSQLREGLTGDGGDEARLREKWNAFDRRLHRELAYRGLPAAGLPQLERIEAKRREPKKLGGAIADVREQLEAGR